VLQSDTILLRLGRFEVGIDALRLNYLQKLIFVGTCSLFLAISIVSARAQSAEPDDQMILSKSDATMIFSLSRDQWNKNVSAAAISGEARAMGKAENGYGMVSEHVMGFMIVNPDYSSEDKPGFIQVSVAYRAPYSSQINDQTLMKTILQAREELAPEFSVIGDVQHLEGGLGVFFIILQE
jgi:hypothetical protein